MPEGAGAHVKIPDPEMGAEPFAPVLPHQNKKGGNGFRTKASESHYCVCFRG